MPKNSTKNGIHAQRLKQIRPFINFDFDLRQELTQYQKRKIKTYWDEINALTARPYQVYKPKSKKRLKTAQDFAQHDKRLPGLKVAFIPVANPAEKTKIRFSKTGELIATTEHVRTRMLPLDTAKLIKDPIAHVKEVVGLDKQAKRFTALCGRYEIPVSNSRETIPEFIAKLTTKYSNQEAGNFHGNWLHGIAAHHFENQSDYSSYMRDKSKAKRKIQNERKKAKRRARYASETVECLKCSWKGKRYETKKGKCPKCGASVI